MEAVPSQGKKYPTEYIYSTVKSFVEQQQYFFDMLWNKSIPADIRINEIEEGIKPNVLETITDPFEIKKIYLNLLKSATNEIMLVIPTVNAIRRHADIGVFDNLRSITSTKKNIKNNENIKIRILNALAKTLGDMSNYDESLIYSNRGIDLCISNESMYLFGELHYQAGESLIKLGKIEQGKEYMEKSMTIFTLQRNERFVKLVEKELEALFV